MDPKEINDTFREFYKSLYSSEYPPNSDAQTLFLDNLQFPIISKEVKTNLDSNLTANKIVSAIDAMNSGKPAGPDGLPVDIYKKFKHKLLFLLWKCFMNPITMIHFLPH